jgi:hypothetical protein
LEILGENLANSGHFFMEIPSWRSKMW